MSLISRRLLMALCLLAAAGFLRLGFWQLSRLDERRASNRMVLAARSAPVVDLSGSALASADSLVERRVTAEGSYDRGRDIVLRGGALEGVPGVNIVTPLRLRDSDTAVLVERGFVPSPDAVTVEVDSLYEPGAVEVTGILRRILPGGGKPLERQGHTTWARLDLEALRKRLPYPILPVSIRQVPDSALPSFPRRSDPPPIDEGPHLSYAIQWFCFAGLAVAFAFLVIGRRRQGSRGRA
jgi:surfeit locus 1 family protein